MCACESVRACERACVDFSSRRGKQLEQEKAKSQTSKEYLQLLEFLEAYKDLVAADFLKPKGSPPTVAPPRHLQAARTRAA